MNTPPAEILLDVLERAEIGLAVMSPDYRFLYINDPLAAMNGLPVADHHGRRIEEVLPELGPSVRELYDRVLGSGDPIVRHNLVGVAGHGPATWDASYVPVQIAGGTGIGVLIVDTTEREKAVAETHRRLSQQAALAELGRLGLGSPDPETVFNAATQTVVRELGADLSGVMRLDPASGHLVLAAGTGFPSGATLRVEGDVGSTSGAGYTLQQNALIVTEDTETEDRYQVSPALLEMGVRSSMSIPIPGRSGPFGVLGALSRRPHCFDEGDGSFLQAAANILGATAVRAEHESQLAGLAAQRGRLVAEALDSGEREQQQVADVLHEDVLQHLLFARLELRNLAGDEAEKGRVMEALDSATQLVRGIVASLRTPTLSHAGLVAALEALSRELQDQSGLRTELEIGPGCEGVADVLVHGAVRELLSHAVAHGRPTRARVTVSARGTGLALVVADDAEDRGPAELEEAMGGGAVGLAGLRERVLAHGGALTIGPGLDGRGTAIELSLPA